VKCPLMAEGWFSCRFNFSFFLVSPKKKKKKKTSLVAHMWHFPFILTQMLKRVIVGGDQMSHFKLRWSKCQRGGSLGVLCAFSPFFFLIG
jgi:hypothetical protein